MNAYASTLRTYREAGNITTDFTVLLDDGGAGVQRKLALTSIDFADQDVVRTAIASALVGIYGDAVTPPEVILTGVSAGVTIGAGTTLTFRGDGYYRVATGVDITEPVVSAIVADVVLRREIAGTGGFTEIDILVNGVSLWSVTPANRPKILFTAGDGARVVSGPPDNPNIAAGDKVEMSILSAEDGNPQDLVAFLRGV